MDYCGERANNDIHTHNVENDSSFLPKKTQAM